MSIFKKKKKTNKKKHSAEFSKWLLIQESALIWIMTIALIVLAYLCIIMGFLGSIPWLAAMVSFPWAAYGVSQVFYYKKALIENSKNGIKYESLMKSLDNVSNALSDSSDSSYNNGDYPEI